ncbi:MAG: hypothetical protein R6U94_01290, partial [Nitriliruptoraceae bacterium]
MAQQPAASGEPDPIPGLEPFGPRQRMLLLVLVVLVIGGLLLVSLVPRTLASGATAAGGTWQVQVTPGLVAPSFTLTVDGQRERVGGERWPGRLQASVFQLGTGHTAVVGSTPWSADSVRLSLPGLGLRESGVRLVGWHRVHVAVLSAPVAPTEVVAIGGGGQVLEVVDDLGPVTPLGAPEAQSSRAAIASTSASACCACSTCRFSTSLPSTVTTPRPSARAASNAAITSRAAATS